MAAKADSLKDEMDEALNKVEICKVDLLLNLSCNAQFSHLLLKNKIYAAQCLTNCSLGMLYIHYLIIIC